MAEYFELRQEEALASLHDLPGPTNSRHQRRLHRGANIFGLVGLASLLLVGVVLVVPLAQERFGENHQKRIFEQVQAEAMVSGTHTQAKPTGSYLHVEQRLRAKLGAQHYTDVVHHQDYEPLPTVGELVAKELGLQPGALLDTREGRRRLAQVSTSGGDAEVLTVANTVPIRIHVDFASLYPATTRPYSQCFKVNDWFKWNFPSTQKPPDLQAGGVICKRGIDPSAQTPGCWGRCTKEDTLTEDMRTYMMEEITTAVAEATTYFRVRKNKKTLKLTKSTGAYQHIYQGYKLPEANKLMCAKDSQLMYSIPVNDKYCDEGINADVILFPQMAQYISGVIGWGADTERDQYGRPLTIAMGWSVPTSSGQRTKGNGRRVTLHEVVHGLSFAIWQFQAVVDAVGVKKDLTEMVKMTDTDGTTDNIWHFKGDRVRSFASNYYNCDKAKLKSLPLMGENSLGAGSRGSHWETRIMYDEFMSYGSGEAVSGFTLAVFEDMGLYLGNYSNSQCTTWGRKQGCDFLTSRCGKRMEDKSHKISVGGTSSEECSRTYKWKYTMITAKKCAELECKAITITENGVPTLRCNAECVPPDISANEGVRDDCGKPPPGYVLASGLKNIDWGSLIQNYDWSYLGIMFIWTMSMTWNIAKCAHRDKHAFLKQVFTLIGFVFVMLGAIPLSSGLYFAADYNVWQGWVSWTLVGVLIGSGLFLICFSMYGFMAIGTENRVKIFIYEICMLGGLALQFTLLYIVITWVRSTYNFETDSFSVLEGKKSDTPDVVAPHVDKALQEVENYSCHTYRRCCGSGADAMEDGRCTAVHSGQAQGASAAELRDPSSPKFCELLTGSKSTQVPDYAVCASLETQGVIKSLDECKTNFCAGGVKGYESFISAMMKWVRSNLVPLSILVGVTALLEIIQIFIGLVMFVQAHEKHTGAAVGPKLGMFSRRWQLPKEELERRQAAVSGTRGGKIKRAFSRAGKSMKASMYKKRGGAVGAAGSDESETESLTSRESGGISHASSYSGSAASDRMVVQSAHVGNSSGKVTHFDCASFGTFTVAFTDHKVVWAEPPDLVTECENGHEVFGNIVITKRGGSSFDVKARRAQEAGAVAIIVVNTSNNDLVAGVSGSAGDDIRIPVVAIHAVDGALFEGETTASLQFAGGLACTRSGTGYRKPRPPMKGRPYFDTLHVDGSSTKNIFFKRAYDFGVFEDQFEKVSSVWCEPDDAAKSLFNEHDVHGKIAICNRGNASYVQKASNAQAAGAIALLVVNNEDGALPMASGNEECEHIRIPIVSIPLKFGKQFQGDQDVTLAFETEDAYAMRVKGGGGGGGGRAKLDEEQLANPLFATMGTQRLKVAANQPGMKNAIEAQKTASWYQQSFAKYHKQYERHFTNTIIAINCMVFALVMYDTNYLFEDAELNPSFGPSGETLIRFGAKSTKEILGGESYRLFTSMFLHTGIIHLVCSSAGLHHIGGGTEQDFGHFAVAFIYLLSGYFGTVISALFLPDYVTVGAGGAVFGLFGACVADVVQNWSVTRRKHWVIIQLLIVIGVQLLVGLMPLVDNFCNIGGFVCGFLCGLCMLVEDRVDSSGKSLGSRWYQVPVEFVSFFTVVVMVGGATSMLFAGADFSDCEICQNVNCVPSVWACGKYDELTKGSTIKPVINCNVETFENKTFSLQCPARPSANPKVAIAGAKFWIDDDIGKASALCAALCKAALARGP